MKPIQPRPTGLVVPRIPSGAPPFYLATHAVYSKGSPGNAMYYGGGGVYSGGQYIPVSGTEGGNCSCESRPFYKNPWVVAGAIAGLYFVMK